MRRRYSPTRAIDGSVIQAAVPKKRDSDRSDITTMNFRAAVLKTYKYGEENASRSGSSKESVAIYCDVHTYGATCQPIFRCLVLQDRSGLHEGEIWEPRPMQRDHSRPLDNLVDENLATNFANTDADHVLVGFMDGSETQPVILGSIPHPQADLGNEDRALGHRMRQREGEEGNRLKKHRGGFWGVTADGNYVIDLTRAHNGRYQPDGTEPVPLGTGANGNYELRLPPGSVVEVKIDGGATLKIEDKDGNAKLTLGDGAFSAAVAEHLESHLDNIKNWAIAHTHTYAFGPTLPPVEAGTYPAWDPNIVSSKIKLPNT